MTTFKLPIAPYWWYRVYIFRTQDQKCAFCKSFVLEEKGHKKCKLPKHNRCRAVVRSTTKSKHPGFAGVIIFNDRSAKSVGIVTHELGHAVTFWWSGILTQCSRYKHAKSKMWSSGTFNEKFCYVIGEMARKYWIAWWKIEEPRIKNKSTKLKTVFKLDNG